MAEKESKTSPLTFSDLADFFNKVIKPELELLASKEDLRVLRSEINDRFDDLYKKF